MTAAKVPWNEDDETPEMLAELLNNPDPELDVWRSEIANRLANAEAANAHLFAVLGEVESQGVDPGFLDRLRRREQKRRDAPTSGSEKPTLLQGPEDGQP